MSLPRMYCLSKSVRQPRSVSGVGLLEGVVSSLCAMENEATALETNTGRLLRGKSAGRDPAQLEVVGGGRRLTGGIVNGA